IRLRVLCTWTKCDQDDKQMNSNGVLMLRTVLDNEYHCLKLSNYVIRPYTPVCNDLTLSSIINTDCQQEKCVNQCCLLIKIYPDGEFSQLVNNISTTGGSGITPMLRIINYLLTDHHQNLQTFKIHLIHFNRCQMDQILISYFQSLHNHFPNNDNNNNHWLYGHITDELCRQCFDQEIIDNFESQTICLICGPSGFNDTAL
ncbi:cytochrome-b5 reductase, partial [Schistosoma bovis]